MDTKSTLEDESLQTRKPSRLPAGSTLLVNGIHVPHPHAEANLAGFGDSRMGDTNAVTETVKMHTDDQGVVRAELIAEPLHGDLRSNPASLDPQSLV